MIIDLKENHNATIVKKLSMYKKIVNSEICNKKMLQLERW